MIEIKGLYKSFRHTKVLKGIDLSVEEGKTLALLGSSGSGKSTLLRCINLLEQPDAGSVRIGDFSFDAKDVSKRTKSAARKQTAMVFQNFGLFENRTALGNVTEALRVVQKKDKEEADEIGLRYLEKVGLSDKRDNFPSSLSGGQKQRVAIARALALDPKVILFDEPTSALDPELVGEVLNVIKQVSESKVTMIIVTHEMDFARDVADEIAFMDSGKILERAKSEDFFLHPKNDRTKQFLERYLQRYTYSI